MNSLGIELIFCIKFGGQLTEAVIIRGNQGPQNLNTKNEFNAQRVHKIVIEKSKPKYNCNICGQLADSEREKELHEKKFHKTIKCGQCKTISYGERALQEHNSIAHLQPVE